MAERESESGFTFVDRRRRSGAEEGPPAPPPAAPAPPAPPPKESRILAPDEAVPEARLARADLSALCVMLYGEAMMHLGQVPDPVSGRPHVDLEQARFSIDLLAMLQEKTEGNRTADESALLAEMLAALRLGFVQLARRQ